METHRAVGNRIPGGVGVEAVDPNLTFKKISEDEGVSLQYSKRIVSSIGLKSKNVGGRKTVGAVKAAVINNISAGWSGGEVWARGEGEV